MSCTEDGVQEDEGCGATFATSEGKILARGILELEVRLKKEISENVLPVNQKILRDMSIIQQNFGRIFNVLERHDTMLQDIVQKFTQHGSRIDKVAKEQEQMRKKIDGLERLLMSSPGGGGGGREMHHSANAATARHYLNGRNYSTDLKDSPSMRASHSGVAQRPMRSNYREPVNTGSIPRMVVPPPPPNFQSPQSQFSSSTKMWTRRGPGEFTSDEDSDDENESEVVNTDPQPVTNTSNDSPPSTGRAASTGRGGGLIGGFGNFRRGKPATKTKSMSSTPAVEATSESKSKFNGGKVLSGSDYSFDNVLNVRPLTSDELEVFSKAGRKISNDGF